MGDAGASFADAGSRRVASARRKDEVEPNEAKGCPARARERSPGDFVVARGMGPAVRDEYRRSDVTGVPDPSGSGIHGLRIGTVGPCLAALGFQDGDVVISINGFDFSVTSSTTTMYESIDSNGAADVRIERAGAVIDLHIQAEH